MPGAGSVVLVRRARLRRGVLPLLLVGAEGGLALPVARGDAVLAHVRGPHDAVELLVEAAAVADLLAVGVAPPQRGHRGITVGASRPGVRALAAKLNVIISLTTLHLVQLIVSYAFVNSKGSRGNILQAKLNQL